MTVGAMRYATLGVSDMDKSLRLFHDVLALHIEKDGAASPALLRAWGLKEGAVARLVELSCKGYPIGRLRLIQFTPAASRFVRLDHGPSSPDSALDVGPKAIDFYVADPIHDTVRDVEKAGYELRSPPVKHQVGDSIQEEVLFSGPDGVPILLMVGIQHPAHSMRLATPDGRASEIATISVIAGDLEASRKFYGDGLGLTPVTDAETPDQYRDLVCDLTGAPRGSRVHFLMYAQSGEPSGKILLVHFFDATGKRLVDRMTPGHLGFSLLSHETKELDQLYEWCRANAVHVVTAPTEINDSGSRYRVMMICGPNEEMFEMIER